METWKRIESAYTRGIWILIALFAIYLVYIKLFSGTFNLNSAHLNLAVGLLLFISAVNLFKTLNGLIYESPTAYILVKFAEFVVFIFAAEVLNEKYSILFIVLVLTLHAGISWGGRVGYILLGYIVVMDLLIKYLYPYIMLAQNYQKLSLGEVLIMFAYIIIGLFGIRLADKTFKHRIEDNRQNTLLFEQLRQKNNQLEDINKKLQKSVAELYTLQQISQALSSIFNMQELLKCVNDIILGVMGTNYSTIIFYDESRKRLKLHTTNINRSEDVVSINDRINCDILLDVLNRAEPLVENNVTSSEYPFTQGRDVKSLICVPFSYKAKMFGLILVEHKMPNNFDDENLRLLSIIGQQVGMAVENAGLYIKMEELATTDGLTGVYNRIFFQNRLSQEFKLAEENKFPLSVAILDIDYFKKFNDSFGHLFGDEVLKKMSELVQNSLRKSDVLARFGGEEFIILFTRTGLKEAYEKVEILRQKISSMTVSDKYASASVTVSFGLCSYPDCALNETDILRMADNALYEAKAAGRNCVKLAGNCT